VLQVGYFMPYIVQFLVEGGSSIGTAMPSSHCGVSSACWLAVVWETKDYQLPFLLVRLYFIDSNVLCTALLYVQCDNVGSTVLLSHLVTAGQSDTLHSQWFNSLILLVIPFPML
jgi:hypothetical protein